METLSLARPSRTLPSPVINGQLFRRFCFDITIPWPLSSPPIRPQHRARTKTSISIIDHAGIILLTDVMAFHSCRGIGSLVNDEINIRLVTFLVRIFLLSVIHFFSLRFIIKDLATRQLYPVLNC